MKTMTLLIHAHETQNAKFLTAPASQPFETREGLERYGGKVGEKKRRKKLYSLTEGKVALKVEF